MTVKVNEPRVVNHRPTFKTGELVISTSANGNIYFVTGKGDDSDTFSGVRLSGDGTFGEVCGRFVRSSVQLFHGQLVISND